MSPPKKKVGCGEDIDPISDLPSNVIDAILQRMPLHDLVKTSVLSRKWRHMWTSVSKLLFADDFFEKCKDLNCLETSSIITEVLFLHNGPIQLFSLSIPTNYAVKMECFSTWILFLSRKGVKKLRLLNLQTIPCQTPSCIFSCQELTYLELQNLKLSIVPNFPGFKNLVQLEIYDVVFESGGLESLMSGCPLLVELTICHCYGFNHINISPPICKLCINGDEVIKSICLKQAQKLIDLTLWAETDRHADNLERGWVSDFTRGLPKIMNLSLGSGYVKILSTSINPQLLRPDTLKYLRLCVNLNEAEELKFFLSLLERASNLKELVIKIYSKAVMQEMILTTITITLALVSFKL